MLDVLLPGELAVKSVRQSKDHFPALQLSWDGFDRRLYTVPRAALLVPFPSPAQGIANLATLSVCPFTLVSPSDLSVALLTPHGSLGCLCCLRVCCWTGSHSQANTLVQTSSHPDTLSQQPLKDTPEWLICLQRACVVQALLNGHNWAERKLSRLLINPSLVEVIPECAKARVEFLHVLQCGNWNE